MVHHGTNMDLRGSKVNPPGSKMILWRPTCMARILVGAACVRDISAVRDFLGEFLSYEINQNRKRASGQTRLLYSRVLIRNSKSEKRRGPLGGEPRTKRGPKSSHGNHGDQGDPFKRFGHNWAFQALSKRNTSDGFDPCMPL